VARRNITLHQVPPEARAKGASEARKGLLQMLSNPQLTNEQRAEIREKLKWTSKWEACDISEILPSSPEVPQTADRQPVNHDVTISETLGVRET
jgi:hypothetical protein